LHKPVRTIVHFSSSSSVSDFTLVA
jgi:hypothetical protein